MPVVQAKCIKSKSYVTYANKKEIFDFIEGKIYKIVSMQSSNLKYVISESGYKEIFSNDYYTYFKDVFETDK